MTMTIPAPRSATEHRGRFCPLCLFGSHEPHARQRGTNCSMPGSRRAPGPTDRGLSARLLRRVLRRRPTHRKDT